MGNEAQEWHKRAASALLLAKSRLTADIVLEDLCFQAQQAVEKALKGILINHGQRPPRSHNIAFLLKEVAKFVEIPVHIEDVVELTEYSVMIRYPGDYPPVQEIDYEAAIEMAEKTAKWARHVIQE